MTRFGRFCIALAALIMLPLLAQSAAASTVGWNEKIDFVRDLPNEDPFENDGRYFDLGYLWSPGGSANTGYVLYHDDRYVVLDADKMALVKEYLGEDPAEGYAPPAGAAPIGARPVSRDDYRGWARMKKNASTARDDMPPAVAPTLGGAGGSIFSLVLIGAGLGAVRHQLKRRARRMLEDAGLADCPGRSAASGESFEARIAARLAELQPASGGVPEPPSPPPPPAFGRKIA
jgi:hypothetical protein